MKVVYFLILILILSIFSQCASAEIWATTGVWSYHQDREHGYNETNTGFGFEVGIAKKEKIVAGDYENSIYRNSKYVGVLWEPAKRGDWHLGLLTVAVDGYRRNTAIAVMPAIPFISWEHERIGVNLIVIPYVVSAVQFKIKLLE